MYISGELTPPLADLTPLAGPALQTIYLPICLSIYLFIYLSIDRSIFRSSYLYPYICIYPGGAHLLWQFWLHQASKCSKPQVEQRRLSPLQRSKPYIYLSISLSIYLSIYLSIELAIYIHTYVYIREGRTSSGSSGSTRRPSAPNHKWSSGVCPPSSAPRRTKRPRQSAPRISTSSSALHTYKRGREISFD